MTEYGKDKRKNMLPAPRRVSMAEIIASFITGLIYYGIIAPIHLAWRISWASWLWVWRSALSLSQKVIFTPIISLARLLGFAANPIPQGLSPIEAEIYQRINRHYRRQKRWLLHVLTFLICLLPLWTYELFFANYDPRFGMLVFLSLIWMIALGGHRLWMSLGDSEDHEIGNALQQVRQTQQAFYYEEEWQAENPDAYARLADLQDDSWLHKQNDFKAKQR
ncbi:hypothetical protein MASR2M15_15630 [Anaerolineales bacterium]